MFGPDDPITWSQLYNMDHPYLACILISDPDENSLVCTFQHSLQTNQMTMTDDWDRNHRVYRLSDDLAHELKSQVDSFMFQGEGLCILLNINLCLSQNARKTLTYQYGPSSKGANCSDG